MTGDAPSPKATLEGHGLRPKRSFGQNFLADPNVAAKIAALATTPVGGTVVEIGAGLGALTGPLLARAARVAAIERDRDLVPVLTTHFATSIAEGRLRVLEEDAKAATYPALFEGAPRPRVLAGNLPYQITGPILELTAGLADLVDRAVFMVQLEVANRLVAEPSEADYGALTVFLRAAFDVERAMIVRRGAFYPQPNVDSAVVVLAPRRPRVAEETELFRAIVKGAFAQRRKTLRNAWRALPGVDAALLAAASGRAGVDLDARGETLDVTAFARMTAELERGRS